MSARRLPRWPAVVVVSLAFASAARESAGAGASPTRVKPGEVFVMRLPRSEDPPESATFLGRTYPPVQVTGERGPLFLLGTDLDTVTGRERVVVRRRSGKEDLLGVTVEKRVFPVERLSLPPAMVTPPKELEERILREQELAAQVYRTSAKDVLWDGGFTRAVDRPASGNFGRRRILNGIRKSPHSGQDYSAPAGTPVKAIAAGKVRIARDFYYSGQTLLLDHGGGLVSQYMHLETMLVAEGESVAAGQVIGRVGSTGRATGPHLHLGARLLEQRVDPESLWDLFPAPAR